MGTERPARIKVLDTVGRIVLQASVLSSAQRFNISGLANGRYVMRVEFANATAPGAIKMRERMFLVMRDR